MNKYNVYHTITNAFVGCVMALGIQQAIEQAVTLFGVSWQTIHVEYEK